MVDDSNRSLNTDKYCNKYKDKDCNEDKDKDCNKDEDKYCDRKFKRQRGRLSWSMIATGH